MVAGRCIAKGEEIVQNYQGHYGDTLKEKRQAFLNNVFHFQCLCTACENDFPLANKLPKTYSETTTFFHDDIAASEDYLNTIKEKFERYNLDQNGLESSKSFRDVISKELKNDQKQYKESIITILKIVDDYHDTLNEELKVFFEMKNVDLVLRLYYERLKIANIFLRPPHKAFLIGRAAVTECLWVKYGNVPYGASRNDLYCAYFS